MKICLNDCLKLDSFKLSRVVACADELDRRVKSVSVLDEHDLDMGIERNGVEDQMVITHFWQCRDDSEGQKKVVTGLGKKGISGFSEQFCKNA